MAHYGSVPGVQAYVRHMTFGKTNNPGVEDVIGWLTARSAKLNSWLAAAGYTTPVTHAESLLILADYANKGAAGDAEMAQRTSGSTSDPNSRASKFLSEFAAAEAFINSGALARLGADHSDANEATSGLSFVTASYGADATTDEYSRPLEYMP